MPAAQQEVLALLSSSLEERDFRARRVAGHTSGGSLLGPRFEVTEQSHDGVGFRHVPAQHSLAAIVSVPAWWPEMEVTVRTYWLDETGEKHPAHPEQRGSGEGGSAPTEEKCVQSPTNSRNSD